jgi:hypothetical protein
VDPWHARTSPAPARWLDLIRQRSGKRRVDSSPDSNLAAMPLACDRRSGPDPVVDGPSRTLQQPLPRSTDQKVGGSNPSGCASIFPCQGLLFALSQRPRPVRAGSESHCGSHSASAAPRTSERQPPVSGPGLGSLRWSRRIDWSAEHEFALAAGALLTYVWYGFVQAPTTPSTRWARRTSRCWRWE